MILRAGYRHIGVLTLAGTAMAAGPLAAQDQQPLVIARKHGLHVAGPAPGRLRHVPVLSSRPSMRR